ncbi:retrovirus-related pol polyprotein from transposon TNT 1-94 [Tanacetum coccineum]
MRTRSQARKRRQQQVRQTSVEPPNLEKPNNNQELFNPPIVTMADNRTMAQLLEAPTEGYEDAIVVPEITANNFEIKHGLLNLVQNKQFFGQRIRRHMLTHPILSTRITFYDEVPERPEYVVGKNFLDKIARECLKIIESKSKVRQSRSKAIVSKSPKAPYIYQWAEKTVTAAEVDACPNACDMWKAIERLKQEWQRFVTLVKQSQELKTVSYHKLYDHWKQHQSQQSTRNRGKAIVTSSAPTYDPEPATVTEDEEMSKEKEIDKLMALISLSFKKIYKPTNNNSNFIKQQSSTPVVQKSGIQCYNCKEYGHVSRECQKPKRVKDAAYHKEKMLLCKQEEAGVQLNAEQQIKEVTPDPVDNSGPIFDDEPTHKVQNNNDNYNVFAMENEHPEQPESSNDIYLTELATPISLLISSDTIFCLRRKMAKCQQHIRIAPGMYKVHTKPDQTRKHLQLHQKLGNLSKRVSFSTGVIPTTSVSRPQLKSDHLEERVLSNNSQGKKQEVEDHQISGETVKFGNDQIAPILGYGDLVQGTITIKRVYYVEGLNHNLFSVGQFCDADLEVAFRKSTCYIRDLKGNDLLTGSRGTDLYSISLQDSTTPNPICLMAKATSSQAWLWHRRLSHLNFDTINLLSKNNIVNGLPKLKFVKDHLCSSCELGKAKRKSFHTKTTPSSKRRLQLLHMDLCGPMRVESINGKKYVLVIVDDYSRYTWTHFLRSKDETPGVLIDFLTLVQRGLHAQVTTVRTDKGTEFLNKTLHAYFAKEGIRHETSTAQTPKQNGVVKRRNRTPVEAARTMLSTAKVPLFFWAEAITTACFTQNRSLVIPRHEKTPYHIINARKLLVKFFHIFGSLCYIIRDGENLDKMKEKGDACIFVGYSTQSKAYRVFNKRTRIIVETIHVNFDELP